MRELGFTIEYEQGCNRVADSLAKYPQARIMSVSLHATTESLWCVDHLTGSPDAIADIEAAFLAMDHHTYCLSADSYCPTQRTQVLESTDDSRILYSYWDRTAGSASVPHLSLDHLGHGVLFDTHMQERQTTWRIFHTDEADVRAFFDELEGKGADCVDIEFQRLAEASAPVATATEGEELPSKHRDALRAAVKHGYYETPREIDAGELADRLGVPRSTITYRLRRAEEQLAKQHMDSLPRAEDHMDKRRIDRTRAAESAPLVPNQ